MPNWDGLNTEEDWAARLREMSATARDALGSGERPRILDAKKDLIAFIDASPSAFDGELDGLAEDLVDALGKATIEEAFAALDRSTAALARLSKALRERAEANVGAADALRLTRSRAAVTAMNETVDRVEELRRELGEGEGAQQLAEAIDRVVTSIRTLRDRIGGGS